ncbi:hypothetical protein B0T21DRAFT_282757 [Apiosordaria backusii]|uniref:Uncharacterized protein n=1 Tax=Apiosordaria backusii TaxID=314023 RepID=A0AA40EMY6_9PEZI|nr:hypothetical protein B0T21DRAFT_282757 [Apiosordaria backusii]
MAAFGKSIHALLDTYSNCISLLKAFRHRDNEPSTSSPPENALCPQDKQADLRESLKTDRALVEKAYSSRVRESGNRFRKGDARAISSVDSVLRKLKEAIKNLLRISSQKQNLDLDYESLMCLSNASRLEAIKTIDGLSRRLGSPSRSSFISQSSKASSKASKASKASSKPSVSSKSSKTSSGSLSSSPSSHRHKQSPKTSETDKPKRDSAHQEKSASTKRTSPQTKKDIKDGKSGKPSSRSVKPAAPKDPQPAAPSPKSTSPSPSPEPTPVSPKSKPASPKPAPASPKLAKASPKQPKRTSLKHSEKASPKPTAASPKPPSSPSPPTSPNLSETITITKDAHYAMAPIPRLNSSLSHNPRTSPNRISIMSFSSDSTKLGEIPQRKWQPSHRSLYITTTGSPSEEEEDEEYNIRPVFPLKPYTVEVKERGRFWGLFARRGSQS